VGNAAFASALLFHTRHQLGTPLLRFPARFERRSIQALAE
jgi:hypothetical protein